MIIDKLKEELKEKEKDIKEFIGCNDFGLTWSIQTNKPLIDFYCGKHIREDYYYCFRCFNKLKMKQAEISALKKGISACEEILNSQQKKSPDCVNSLVTEGSSADIQERIKDYDDSSESPVQTLIKEMSHYKSRCVDLMCENDELKQALSQRNQEILEIIDNFEIELKNRKKKTKDKLFKKVLESKREAIKELKQQLTNSESLNGS